MDRSATIMEKACKLIPGGVNSPVRACGPVNAAPLVISKAQGPYVHTSDNKRLVDLIGSWGPMILGHRHPRVIAAVEKELANGTSYGAPTENELRFAELLCDALPGLDMVRAVSSGTEATMSALRLARGFTGREKIIKIDGGYHGHADFLLVAAGSGAATLGIPGAKGVTEGSAKDTLLAPFNDLEAIEKLLQANPEQIAALIVEPVAGNMGVVPPNKGYLEGLRKLTKAHGVVLIFDEVMSGFRVAWGGAQIRYNVTPDLSCLGKIIGGGFPAAAFGGRREIMEHLAPLGPVYQAGTLSGNPISLAAGIATLEVLKQENPYPKLEEMGALLETGLSEALTKVGVRFTINRVGTMLTLFFNGDPVENYADAKRSNTEAFADFYGAMRERGMYLPPSQFEAWFLSTEHKEDIIEQIISAAAASIV